MRPYDWECYAVLLLLRLFFFFFFNDTATTEIYTLSLHDALPIYRVPHHAHRVRVRDHHGAPQEARFLEPGGTGHFAVAVEREPAREDRIARALAARQDGGDAGTNRSLPDHQLAASRDERRVSDLDAGDVGDGVERARRTVERNPQVAGALLLLGVGGDGRGEQCEAQRNLHGRAPVGSPRIPAAPHAGKFPVRESRAILPTR